MLLGEVGVKELLIEEELKLVVVVERVEITPDAMTVPSPASGVSALMLPSLCVKPREIYAASTMTAPAGKV